MYTFNVQFIAFGYFGESAKHRQCLVLENLGIVVVKIETIWYIDIQFLALRVWISHQPHFLVIHYFYYSGLRGHERKTECELACSFSSYRNSGAQIFFLPLYDHSKAMKLQKKGVDFFVFDPEGLNPTSQNVVFGHFGANNE